MEALLFGKYIITLIFLWSQLSGNSHEIFLDTLIADAIKNNPNILSKQSIIKSAQHKEDGSYWQYFPTPIVTAETKKGGERSSIVGLKQPLFAGGRIDAEYEKSKFQVNIATMSNEEMKESIAFSIIQSYYIFLNAYARELIYIDSIARLEKHKEMIKRKIEQDVSPRSDLLLVDSRIAQMQTELSYSIVTKEKGLFQLSRLLAKQITIDDFKEVLPKKSCDIVLEKIYENNDFVEQSLKSSPTIARLEEEIKVAKSEIKIKESSFYPNIFAKVERSFVRNQEDETNGGFVLELNSGAGLSSISNHQSAKVNLLTAKHDMESSILDLKEKFQTEMSEYQITTKRYQNYLFAVELAEKTLESFERLFVAGKKTWLEVLNSEKDWTNAQLSLSETQAYLSVAPLKLKIYANELSWQKGKE